MHRQVLAAAGACPPQPDDSQPSTAHLRSTSLLAQLATLAGSEAAFKGASNALREFSHNASCAAAGPAPCAELPGKRRPLIQEAVLDDGSDDRGGGGGGV